MGQLDANASEDEIAILIDGIKKTRNKVDDLTGLLPRKHAIYRNRGTNQVNRIRGYAMATFEKTGLPEEALVYVCEELDNGHSPYLIAAAAMALRGLTVPPRGLAPFLTKALLRVAHNDEAVSFDTFRLQGPLSEFTTATNEILKSLAWMGREAREVLPVLEAYSKGYLSQIDQGVRARALETIEQIKKSKKQATLNCCRFPQFPAPTIRYSLDKVKHIVLEDQEGNRQLFGNFFSGSFTLVTFFYTRCDNPSKCSLTITKLAQLQELLKTSGLTDVNVAAISYDSEYDAPERLKSYTANRGFRHDDRNKTFRVLTNLQGDLFDYFALDVNYNMSIVNNHSIELFILNKKGQVVNHYSRIEFNNEAVIHFLKLIHKNSWRKHLRLSSSITNSLLSFFISFFPKCPICWAGYLSLFGLSGISWLQFNPNLFWLLVGVAVVNSAFMFRQAQESRSYYALLLALIGYMLLVLAIKDGGLPIFKPVGLAIIIGSSLLSVFQQNFDRTKILEHKQ